MVERDRAAALATPLNSHRIITFPDELLVQDVEHLEERSVLLDSRDVVGLKMTLFTGVLLTPYLKIEIHIRLFFVVSGFDFDKLVFERLLVEFRLFVLSLVLPSGDVHVIGVIPLGLAFLGLALYTEMTTAGLVPV